MSGSIFAFAGEKLIAEGLKVEVKGKMQNFLIGKM